MSKRLQVIMSEEEMARLRAAAHREQLTVAEIVRQAVKKRIETARDGSIEEKLRAIERAASYSFPAPGIEQMNAEIEQGYLDGLP